jgi:8-oxo-dGTP pyrophosphatase MutT (NUDIX family)
MLAVFVDTPGGEMKKSPSPITILAILGSVFSIFALGVTVWLLFFFKPDSSPLDQTVYWFLIALVAAVIPYIKQIRWKDLEIHLKEIESKVDEIANRRYANLIYLVDQAGNLALVYHKEYKVWIPCGTRLNPYEQPHEAVHRAISEELGFREQDYTFWPVQDYPKYGKVQIVPTPYQVQEEYRTHRGGVPEHYDFVYVCRASEERPTLRGKPELKSRWVSFGELTREVETGESERVTFADVLPTYEKILREMGVVIERQTEVLR